MRFFLVILTIIILFYTAFIAQAEESKLESKDKMEELFLVKIISINNDQHEIVLEMIDGNGIVQNGDKNVLYKFESIPESLKEGDIIRIWGTMETKVETKGNINTKEIGNVKQASIIRGKIAGISNRIGGDDPTGVRKRLKRRILIHQPSGRGAGRGG